MVCDSTGPGCSGGGASPGPSWISKQPRQTRLERVCAVGRQVVGQQWKASDAGTVAEMDDRLDRRRAAGAAYLAERGTAESQ